jgi:hemerythrin
MAPIEWDEKYSVNVQEIDDQHKKLFSLFNELQKGIASGNKRDALAQELSDLIDYTALHFATEEKLMQKFSYIGFVEHKRIHDDLLSEAKGLQKDFSEGKIELNEKTNIFLTDWLTDHIIDMDKKYAPLFKSKGAS